MGQKVQYISRLVNRKNQPVKRVKYTHDLLCECQRCDPGIITKWRKISLKDLA